MTDKLLVRYSMHEDNPIIIKDPDEHLGETIERKESFLVKSTVVDDSGDGRWHEEIVFADDESQAEKMYTLACEEFGYELLGNMDISEADVPVNS